MVQGRGCSRDEWSCHLASSLAKLAVASMSGNGLYIPLRRSLRWVGNADVLFSQRGNPPHLFVAEREVEHIEVFDDVPVLEGAGHCGDDWLLNEPAKADLRVRLSACLRDLADHRVVE